VVSDRQMLPALERKHLPADEGGGGQPDEDGECVGTCDLVLREAWQLHVSGYCTA
jgi:hypothetical protein